MSDTPPVSFQVLDGGDVTARAIRFVIHKDNPYIHAGDLIALFHAGADNAADDGEDLAADFCRSAGAVVQELLLRRAKLA